MKNFNSTRIQSQKPDSLGPRNGPQERGGGREKNFESSKKAPDTSGDSATKKEVARTRLGSRDHRGNPDVGL